MVWNFSVGNKKHDTAISKILISVNIRRLRINFWLKEN